MKFSHIWRIVTGLAVGVVVARADYVQFVDITEGSPVISSSGWDGFLGSFVEPEHAQIDFKLNGAWHFTTTYQSGFRSFVLGLVEPGSSILSDFLSIQMVDRPGYTEVAFEFMSDGYVDPYGYDFTKVPLNRYDMIADETGLLQMFGVAITDGNSIRTVNFGIQSDVETVPDGGSTAILLAGAVFGLCGLTRKLRRSR